MIHLSFLIFIKTSVNSPLTGNIFVDDLAAATFAIRTESVTARTDQKTATAWRRWTSYLRSIDVADDNFFESFSVDQRLQIVLAFAAAMRGARFSPGYTKIKEGSVYSTVDYVAQVFRANNRRDPRLDSSDVKQFLLSRLLRAYRNTDPDVKHQKAVRVSLIRLILSSASSPFELFNAHLLIVAFFFTMRSCEYTTVLVSSSMILATLRAAADSMGEDVLGFTSSEIGCHSIQSACAMALFLAGYAEFTIMLIGRWRSYSFLRYIRKQMQQFYSGISSHMIQREHFFTIPRL